MFNPIMKISLKPTIVLFSILVIGISSSYGRTVEDDKLERNNNFAEFLNDALSDLPLAYEVLSTMNNHNSSLLDELDILFNRSVHSGFIDHLLNTTRSKCARDFKYTLENIWSQEEWAIEMLDSYGKPESGILQGYLHWIGNYDECVKVYAPQKPNSTNGNFHGQYCTLNVLVNVKDMEEPAHLGIGVCLPDSCIELEYIIDKNKETDRQVSSGSGQYFDSLFSIDSLTCLPTSKKITNAAIGLLFLLSIAVLITLIGSSLTAYEYFTKRHSDDFPKEFSTNGEPGNHPICDGEKAKIEKTENEVLPDRIRRCKAFFNCFCVFTNGEKLLNTSNVEGQMLCLHGIRFLSMSWVMICHTYMYCYSLVGNGLEALVLVDSWLFQLILNGFFAVDSFFLLSGFLLAYIFFERSSKSKGKISWIYFYVHRYFRITPLYMVVLGFETAIHPLMGSGPFWPPIVIEPHCQKTWWWNILYISNFYQNNEKLACMGWSWYLSNDMQFFVMSPLLLVTLSRMPVVGFSILTVLFCIAFVSNFAITYYYKLPTSIPNLRAFSTFNEHIISKWTEYMEKIYEKPYTRMGPYLIGIILGYYLHKQRNKSKNTFAVLSFGWIITVGVTLLCIFGLYHRDLSILEISFYNGLSNTCVGCCLGWVVYVCLTGQANFINKLLSFKLFIPLSRLTFSAYLVHPIVQSVYFDSSSDHFDFSHGKIVVTFLGLMVISYGTAFAISLLFESPIIRLEKFAMEKFCKN